MSHVFRNLSVSKPIVSEQLSRLRLPHLQSLTLHLDGSRETVTVRNGVRHLLEIPSLTRLELSWLSEDEADHLRLIQRALFPDHRGLIVIDADTAEAPWSAGLFDI